MTSCLLFSLQDCNDRTGVSYKSVLKYIVKKYPGMEISKKKFLIRKAMKKHLEKGNIRQVIIFNYHVWFLFQLNIM